MHWWWMRAFSSAYGSTETTLGGVGRWPFGLRATTVPPSPCFERRSCSPISVPRQAQALLAALRILLDRHHGLREVVHRLREVRAGLGEDGGRTAVDRDRDHPVGRHLDLHRDLEGSFDLALAQPDLRVRPVQDVPDPRRREREELERLHREAHVLEGRHVEAAQDEQLVRPVERREHRAVEERRGVDDDRVVALACNLEQSGDLRLGDELGVLRAQRRREDVEPARMLRRVAGELLHVEFSGCHDEVIDRLLGLDAHHDRRIAELQVEVEQQRLATLLGERSREVRRGDRLAGAALRREHRDHAAGLDSRDDRRLALGVRGLADREDHVVHQLREDEHVGDVGRQRFLEQLVRGARSDDDDRAAGLLADGGHFGAREALGPRPVQDAAEMPPGEDAGGLGDVVAPAHHLELGVVAQAVAELREAVAVTGEVDPCAWVLCCLAHFPLPRKCAMLRSVMLSLNSLVSLSTSYGVSVAFVTGRSCRDQPSAFWTAKNTFWMSRRSLMASITELSPEAEPTFDGSGPVVGARRTSMLRATTRVACPLLPSPYLRFAITSTGSASLSVPARTWSVVPWREIARSVPCSCERMPSCAREEKRRRVICSPA